MKTPRISARTAWIQPGTLTVCALLSAVSSGLGGCALFQPLTYNALEQRVATLEADNGSLERQLAAREKETAHLQLEILEKTTRIRELEQTLEQREQELKQNQERLLRKDTRIQTLTGPAQAASAIAEAEAAYRIAVAQGRIEAAEAISGLLAAATSAFEAGRYARAIDLADQVMRRLYRRGDGTRRSGKVASVEYPEIPLMNPVSFRVRVKSHVRRGPGMGFAPTAILPPQTQVTGLATRGHWVKIRGPGQLQGWIYRKLLAAPD